MPDQTHGFLEAFTYALFSVEPRSFQSGAIRFRKWTGYALFPTQARCDCLA